MDRFGDTFFVSGDLGLCSIQESVGTGDVELRASSAFERSFGDTQGFGLIAGVFLRDIELSLGTAKFEIVDGDLGLERDEHILHVGLSSGAGGFGGLHGTPHASKKVKFVISVKASAPGFDGASAEGGIHGATKKSRVISAAGGDGGREVELRFAPQSTGL